MRIDAHSGSGPPTAPTKALRLRPRDWLDLAAASVALGVARLRIASHRARVFRSEEGKSSPVMDVDQRIERVRVAIIRASGRLPWRTDCLVQALAARDWLHRLGVDTSLCIGIPEDSSGQFEAHAWLMHGKSVITGGDIRSYIPLLNSGTGIELNRSRKI